MPENKDLSSKVCWTTYDTCRYFIGRRFFVEEDVKEFIRKLKEDLKDEQ